MRALAALLLLASAPALADDPARPSLATHGPNWTVQWEPLQLFVKTVSLSVEHAVSTQPSIGVAVVVAGGSHDSMPIGEVLDARYHRDVSGAVERVRFQRGQGGVQANWYFLRPMSGPHLGVEVTLKQFFPNHGDDVSVITASPYLAWKWVFGRGITISLTAGASLVYSDDDQFRPMRPGWERDDRGSFGPLHMFAGLGIGWSFNDGSP